MIQNEENTPWTNYVNYVKERNTNFTVLDLSYLQFPNYLLKIEMTDQINTGVQLSSYLVVSLSLLVPFYTVFTVSAYKLGGFEAQNRVKHRLISVVTSPSTGEAFLSDIHTGISNYFKDYQYIDYKLPFSKIVTGGVPYGFGLGHKADFTIYDFLFSNDLVGLDYNVY